MKSGIRIKRKSDVGRMMMKIFMLMKALATILVPLDVHKLEVSIKEGY